MNNQQKTVINISHININTLHINIDIATITLNINGLNKLVKSGTFRVDTETTVCYLQEAHFQYKVTYRLKVKRQKKLYHANTHQKKSEVTKFITKKVSEKRKLSGIEQGIT